MVSFSQRLGVALTGATLGACAAFQEPAPSQTPGTNNAPSYLVGDKAPPWGSLSTKVLAELFPKGKLRFSDDLFTGELRSLSRSLFRQELGKVKETNHDWGPKGTVVYHSRSLGRHYGPRVLASSSQIAGLSSSVDDRFEGAKDGAIIPGRVVFLGYTANASTLEMIIPNSEGTGNGAFSDFFVVKNFGEGLTPVLEYSPPGACTACHEQGKLIFPYFPWSEARGFKPGEPLLDENSESMIEKMRSNGVSFSRVAFHHVVRASNIQNEFSRDDFAGPALTSVLPDRIPLKAFPNQIAPRLDPLFRTTRGGAEIAMTSAVACRLWTDNKQRGPAAEDTHVVRPTAREVFDESCGSCHDGTHSVPKIWFEVAKELVGSAGPHRNGPALTLKGLMPPHEAPALKPLHKAVLMDHMCSGDNGAED